MTLSIRNMPSTSRRHHRHRCIHPGTLFLLCACTTSVSALLPMSFVDAPAPSGRPEVTSFSLAPMKLAGVVNAHLDPKTDSPVCYDCDGPCSDRAARHGQAVCDDAPGISGLAYEACGAHAGSFVAVADRGPNLDCRGSEADKAYPMPAFAPAMGRLTLQLLTEKRDRSERLECPLFEARRSSLLRQKEWAEATQNVKAHTPVFNVAGGDSNRVEVTVGRGGARHPSVGGSDESAVHYIANLHVVNQDGVVVAMGEYSPAAGVDGVRLVFDVPTGTTSMKAYAFCNRHGMFVSQRQVVRPSTKMQSCDLGACLEEPVGGEQAAEEEGEEGGTHYDAEGRCVQLESIRAEALRRQRVEHGEDGPFLPAAGNLKHMPVVVLTYSGYKVTVGVEGAVHPTVGGGGDPEAVHYIETLYVTNEKGEVVAAASPSPVAGAAVMEFDVPNSTRELTPYAFCNRHGLFQGTTMPVRIPAGRMGLPLRCDVAACLGRSTTAPPAAGRVALRAGEKGWTALRRSGDDGAPVSGLPNKADDGHAREGGERPFACGAAVGGGALRPDGLDLEEVQVLGGGLYVGSEEYAPSLVVWRGDTGEVVARYVPGVLARDGTYTEGKTGYAVVGVLPDALAARRANRGIEAVAVDARRGRVAYCLQSAADGGQDDLHASRVVRCGVVDVRDVRKPVLLASKVVLASEATEGYMYPGKGRATAQKDVKFSAGAWLGGDTMLLLEKGKAAGGAVAARLVAVDLSTGTDLRGVSGGSVYDAADGVGRLEGACTKPAGAAGCLRKLGAPVEAMASRVVFDFEAVGKRTGADSKLEGLAIVNRHTVVVGEDNDFGYQNKGYAKVHVVRLPQALEGYEAPRCEEESGADGGSKDHSSSEL